MYLGQGSFQDWLNQDAERAGRQGKSRKTFNAAQLTLTGSCSCCKMRARSPRASADTCAIALSSPPAAK